MIFPGERARIVPVYTDPTAGEIGGTNVWSTFVFPVCFNEVCSLNTLWVWTLKHTDLNPKW